MLRVGGYIPSAELNTREKASFWLPDGISDGISTTPVPSGAGFCHTHFAVEHRFLFHFPCCLWQSDRLPVLLFGLFYPGGEVISLHIFKWVIWKHPHSPASSLVSNITWCWLRAEPSFVPRLCLAHPSGGQGKMFLSCSLPSLGCCGQKTRFASWRSDHAGYGIPAQKPCKVPLRVGMGGSCMVGPRGTKDRQGVHPLGVLQPHPLPFCLPGVLLPSFPNLCSSLSPIQVRRRCGRESPPHFPGP